MNSPCTNPPTGSRRATERPDSGSAAVRLRVIDATAHPPRSGAWPRPWTSSLLGLAVSIPWCCIVPAVLASLGLASSFAGWLGPATPALLAVSAILFARAHYLLWVKRHGSGTARAVTVAFTAMAAVLWAVRLSPSLAERLLP